jgi:hypothetical protein
MGSAARSGRVWPWSATARACSARRFSALAGAGLAALAIGPASAARAAGTGSISGTVTVQEGGSGLAGVEVCAFPVDIEAVEGGEGSGFGCAVTGAGGAYEISGLAPEAYDVEFLPPASGSTVYAPQYYDGVSRFREATAVEAAAGGDAQGIDAVLHPAGAVSGKVISAATSNVVPGVEACASLGGEEGPVCDTSDAQGEYTIPGLAAGAYVVEFLPPRPPDGTDYARQFYDEAPYAAGATPVAVTPGGTAAAVDASLQEGGEIAGRVTSAAGGAPIALAVACAYPNQSHPPSECAATGADGRYKIFGLVRGGYGVGFAASGYVTQYYSGAPSLLEGAALAVEPARALAGVDATLERLPETQPPPAPPPVPGVPPAPSGTPPDSGAHAPGLAPSGTAPSPAGAAAAPAGGVSLAGASLSVQGGGVVLVRLRCAGRRGCVGRLLLTARRPVPVHGRRVSRSVPIGSSRYSIPSGRTATAKLSLGALGRALFAAGHGQLAARLAIEPGQRAGGAAAANVRLLRDRYRPGS